MGSLRRSLASLRPILKYDLLEYSRVYIASNELRGDRIRGYATYDSDVRQRRLISGGILQDRLEKKHGSKPISSPEHNIQFSNKCLVSEAEPPEKQRIGQNLSAQDKREFLINTLFDLKNSKEAVYCTLDAWVAWEQTFPLASLKKALVVLEKEEQWHRIVQVLKWMLSKGQGTTTGTYGQLIQALEKDNRAEEAHKIWVKKLSHDLHSVPWRVCELMISIYYRNNMLKRLVELFKGLEEFDRKPPRKSIVRKVADAYELLDLLEEKNRVLEKYSSLFDDSASEKGSKKRRKLSQKASKEAGKKESNMKQNDNHPVDSGPSDDENDGVI